MNQTNPKPANFAVKRRLGQVPYVVAIVESYDDAVIRAERLNARSKDETHYPSVHFA